MVIEHCPWSPGTWFPGSSLTQTTWLPSPTREPTSIPLSRHPISHCSQFHFSQSELEIPLQHSIATPKASLSFLPSVPLYPRAGYSPRPGGNRTQWTDARRRERCCWWVRVAPGSRRCGRLSSVIMLLRMFDGWGLRLMSSIVMLSSWGILRWIFGIVGGEFIFLL